MAPNAAQTGSAGENNTKVFISYARADFAFVERLGAALKARGIEPLIDQTEIAAFDEWWKRIETIIARADTFVFVVSPDSVASSVCGKEVAFAQSLNKRLAPIVWRRVDDSAVPEALAKVNYIFFDDETRFDAGVDTLVAALITDIEWVRKHTELGEHARRWAAAGRPGPRGLLLRSPVLEEAERWIASRPPAAPPPTEDVQAFVAESRRATTRRRNILTAGLAAGFAIALVLAGFAYWQRSIAIEQERIAQQERRSAEQQRAIAERNEALANDQRDKALLTQSRFLADLGRQRWRSGDAAAAILLGIEALSDEHDGTTRPYAAEAEATLFIGWQHLQESCVLAVDYGLANCAAFSPDGRRVAAGFTDGKARIRTARAPMSSSCRARAVSPASHSARTAAVW